MRRGAERVEWTTGDLAYLRANAGEIPLVEIARTLKRSRAAVYSKAHELGLSVRCYVSTLEWCDQCATKRTELDADGRCPVCRLRAQLDAAEQRVADALAAMPPDVREQYAATETLRASRAVTPPRPALAGLEPYRRKQAEDAHARAVEAAETANLQRRVDAAKTRLKRIREKTGANPRKRPRG